MELTSKNYKILNSGNNSIYNGINFRKIKNINTDYFNAKTLLSNIAEPFSPYVYSRIDRMPQGPCGKILGAGGSFDL